MIASMQGLQGLPVRFLAPEGAVLKLSGTERGEHRGPARVFDSEEQAFEAVQRQQIKAGDKVVIVGGTISPTDAGKLKEMGVAEVFIPGTPIKNIADFIKNVVIEISTILLGQLLKNSIYSDRLRKLQ